VRRTVLSPRLGGRGGGPSLGESARTILISGPTARLAGAACRRAGRHARRPAPILPEWPARGPMHAAHPQDCGNGADRLRRDSRHHRRHQVAGGEHAGADAARNELDGDARREPRGAARLSRDAAFRAGAEAGGFGAARLSRLLAWAGRSRRERVFLRQDQF
jgi:hypothetical protein